MKMPKNGPRKASAITINNITIPLFLTPFASPSLTLLRGGHYVLQNAQGLQDVSNHAFFKEFLNSKKLGRRHNWN